MKFTATQIAGILEGKVEGNPNVEVWNVAKIEEGAPGMISFLANPKYTHYIYETKSSIVIVNDDFEATAPIQATLIRVPDAYACFAKLLAFYDQMTQNKQGVSSLAFVSKSAQCGENLYLGEFAFVGENVKIGNNVKLYPQVYVGDGCIIGDNTVLYPGVKLYRNTMVGEARSTFPKAKSGPRPESGQNGRYNCLIVNKLCQNGMLLPFPGKNRIFAELWKRSSSTGMP